MAVDTAQIDKPSDIETDPEGVVKRWIAEWDSASAVEKDWRDDAENVWGIYRSRKPVSNSFNILWSNSETLRPALYNSTPRPDVRRRYRDADPVGRVVSVVLERALGCSIDLYDFDHTICQTVLDVVVPGRGVARIKYEPKFRPIATEEAVDPYVENEGANGPSEEKYDENAECAHVQWDAFRHGPGKIWDEVEWVGFEHRMPYDQLVTMFGKEMAKQIKLDGTQVYGKQMDDKRYGDKDEGLLKTAAIYEIWDKVKKRVLFIAPSFKKMPVKVEDDPLHVSGFFPMPRPIYVIEDSASLEPHTLYRKYCEQAMELNTITQRINRIVKALRVRGAYASNLSELKSVIEAGDNEMQPIANASEIANLGGLDKAIWILPIDKLQSVLHELFAARAASLQTIYEITGLGDVMRGVSNPHETLGAQEIKSQWGTLRLQKLQREVQRFIRDIFRIKAEIMGEHFSPETLQRMTQVQLPTAEEKQQVQQLFEQQKIAAASPPQPDPEMVAAAEKMLATPTWDDVMEVLRSDAMRQYRIDIETDSTIAELIARDTQDMLSAITAITQLFTTLGPIVQTGVMSIEVAKQLCLAVARNAKMGAAVEEAIDAMVQPPPAEPEPDNSVQVAQLRAESAEKLAAGKAQADAASQQQSQAHDQQMAQMKEQARLAADQQREETKRLLAQVQAESEQRMALAVESARAERELTQQEHEARIVELAEAAESQRVAMQQQAEADRLEFKTQFEGAIKVLVAEIGAKSKADAAEAAAEKKSETESQE